MVVAALQAGSDMRKSFNTLAALVEHQLGHDPYAGDVFVFIGRQRNRMKVLVWDASGFWLVPGQHLKIVREYVVNIIK